MKRMLAHKKLRYLSLLPIVILIIMIIVNNAVTEDVDMLAYEQHMEKIGLIAEFIENATESHEVTENQYYQENLVNLATVGDKMEYISIVPYKSNEDGTLDNISEDRTFAVNELDPIAVSKELRDAVAGSENGYVEYTWHIPETEIIVEMRIYYRWIDNLDGVARTYLLTAAVGKDSADYKISDMFYILQYVNTFIVLVLSVWFTVLFATLGHIYCEREGKRKWRNEREEG